MTAFDILPTKGSLLFMGFAIGNDMMHLNNKKKNYDNNRHNVIAAATTSILAIAIIMVA
jgi:hypothetical protein